MGARTAAAPISATELRGSTINKVVRVLQALLASGEQRSLAQVSDQLDLPKPTVHRLLIQLEDAGLVQPDPLGKFYTVGETFLGLATDALSVAAHRPPIRIVLQGLVDQIRESCNLSILQRDQVVYLERVECDWPLRLQLRAGSRVPVHCTASGKLFLAHLTPAKREATLKSLQLNRFTEHTLTNIRDLERECAAIRDAGFSVNRQEYQLGLIGVAVPVMRDDATPVAALAVHAPIFRMSIDLAKTYVPHLRIAAAEVAKYLGFGAPQAPSGLANHRSHGRA